MSICKALAEMHSLNAKHCTIYNEWSSVDYWFKKAPEAHQHVHLKGVLLHQLGKPPVNVPSSWKGKCASFPLSPLWSAERKEKSCNFISSRIVAPFRPYFPYMGQSHLKELFRE